LWFIGDCERDIVHKGTRFAGPRESEEEEDVWVELDLGSEIVGSEDLP